MYSIKEKLVKVNGQTVKTFEREIIKGNTVFRIETGTTGYGGSNDRDKGGRTYLCMECLCGDFCFHPIMDEEERIVGIEIATCGDDGITAIVRALTFAREVINDQRHGIDD